MLWLVLWDEMLTFVVGRVFKTISV